MKKITQEEYFKFLVDFEEARKQINQRLGQGFCNIFNITDSELFYQPDDFIASKYITDNYVEFKWE